MKKKLIAAILTAVLIVFAGGIYLKNGSLLKRQTVKEQKISVSLKLPGNSDYTSFSSANGRTALDLLQNKAKIDTKGQGVNAYVTTINGRTTQDIKKEYWAFYINGKMSPVGAGSYKLKDNDKIEWKIANY